MAERRISLHLRRDEDPGTSRDPRIHDVVAALATLERPPELRPEFRAELRAQLVAIAPRLIEDGKLEARRAEQGSAGATGAAHGRHRRTLSFKRPLLIAASLVTVLAMILGGAVWMSQKSLPGDTLYGLKRTSERVELALDSSDTDRAHDYLRFAQRRVEESRALLGRTSASGAGPQAAGVSAETARLIASALSSSNTNVVDAWKLLAAQAARSQSNRDLATMSNWAPGQLARLSTLAAAAPTQALRASVAKSQGIVEYALGAAAAVAKQYAGRPGSTPVNQPGGTKQTGTGTATRSPNGTGTKQQPGGGSSPSKSGAGTTGPGSSGSRTPGGILPTLPLPTSSIHLPTTPSVKLPTPKLPLKVSPSCVSVSVVIGVGVGDCSSS